MKAGEVKTVEFGKDKGMVAEFTLNRVSRPEKVAEVTPAQDGQDASQPQG
jgi:hypothetical protein